MGAFLQRLNVDFHVPSHDLMPDAGGLSAFAVKVCDRIGMQLAAAPLCQALPTPDGENGWQVYTPTIGGYVVIITAPDENRLTVVVNMPRPFDPTVVLLTAHEHFILEDAAEPEPVPVQGDVHGSCLRCAACLEPVVCDRATFQDILAPTVRNPAVDLLFNACTRRFTQEEWELRLNMRIDPEDLAECDFNQRVIRLFPHRAERDEPIEKTLLHELFHVGFRFDVEHDDDGTVEDLENWMWPRLKRAQKQWLTELYQKGKPE